MKKSSLPILLSAASLMAFQVQAASAVTVYGKANLSLNKVEQESKDIKEWQLNSNASRLGLKGAYEVSEDIEAIYKMEFEVAIDDGDKKDGHPFGQRNIYAGFKGDFGTIIAGMHDTPLKKAQGKVDRFGDLSLADIKNIMEGEDRAKNIVIYTTPKMKGLSAMLALIPGENSPEDDGVADGTSMALNYQYQALTFALANNNDVDEQDMTRFVAEYSFGDTSVGGLWQTVENADDSSIEEDSWLLSAQHKLGTYTLKAQYGSTDYTKDLEDNLSSIGLDKSLGKNAKVYGYFSSIRKDNGVSIADDKTIAFGYELKF